MSDKCAERKLPYWLLAALSWIVSLYCGIDLIHSVGFLPDYSGVPTHVVQASLFLFFMFLPFFTKIKVGKLLELEREVRRTREDVQDFKSEVRNTLSVISTNVNTISGFSNQLTVNLPNTAEIREARREVESKSATQLPRHEKKEELEQLLEREDPTLALAYIRIEIERVLRSILGKRTSSSPEELANMRFASLPRLFDQFLAAYPNYRYLTEAFRYVLQVCNAAIHAQTVAYDQAVEAAGLGGEILLILQNMTEAGAKTS